MGTKTLGDCEVLDSLPLSIPEKLKLLYRKRVKTDHAQRYMRARGVIPTLTAGLRDDWKSENEINEINYEGIQNKQTQFKLSCNGGQITLGFSFSVE